MNIKNRFFACLIALVVLGLAGCAQQDTPPQSGTGNQPNGETTQTSFDPEPYVEAWAKSTHAIPVTFAAERQPCDGCHDGRIFAARGSAATTETTAAPFGPFVVATDCRACHTGNGPTLLSSGNASIPTAAQPVKAGKGALCMSCHNQFGEPDPNDAEHGYPHYGPQADVLNGTGGMIEGMQVVSTDKHKTIEDTCVNCHMTEGPQGHSFAPDLAACKECHENLEDPDQVKAEADYDGDGQAEMYREELQGLMDAVEDAVNKKAGTTEFIAESGEISFISDGTTMTSGVPQEAYIGAYNWVLVEHDKSNGVHNPQFVVSLLQETYKKVTGTALPKAQPPVPSENPGE